MKITKKLTFLLLFAINITANSQSKSIKVEKTGNGTPVLFFPGFTNPGSVWKETAQNLELKGEYHFFSYAGFNGIAPIEMPWYNSIKMAVLDYIKENKLNNITLIGHSMGGSLAIDIAASLPNAVKKAVIVEAIPNLREVMMPNVPAESLYYNSPYNQQMLNMDNAKFKEMASMMATNMTTTKNKTQMLTNWIMEADRRTYVLGYTDLLKLDLRPILNKLTCKTLIIASSLPNQEVIEKNFKEQYQNLTNKTIIVAPNSKHYVMFDQPEWFYKKVNAFLNENN